MGNKDPQRASVSLRLSPILEPQADKPAIPLHALPLAIPTLS